jgi:hypothetical protein
MLIVPDQLSVISGTLLFIFATVAVVDPVFQTESLKL